MRSNPRLNVQVESCELTDYPARIQVTVSIADERFFSSIEYGTIPCWAALWQRHKLEHRSSDLLGCIVAWDCMRFLALGGETLTLCEGLTVPENVVEVWTRCFRKQFGEWRYRNAVVYPGNAYPRLICSSRDRAHLATQEFPDTQLDPRILLTNGGGKDSLVGMMLLNDSGADYDIYQGCLPLGGTHRTQSALLDRLRHAAASRRSRLVTASVADDFYTAPEEKFSRMGVEADHFLSDFAVGHTANYVGYFPIILQHDYSGVWFNIESSADRTMAVWEGENVNHQWCKSTEYQALSTALFRELTGRPFRDGFSSTIRGLNDALIYSIAANEPEKLAVAHSCNIEKPWCRRCPKCCFSYLMMSSVLGELYAQTVMGCERSLFDEPATREHWRDLLDERYVAWECVPSHRECIQAVRKCIRNGVHSELFDRLGLEKLEEEISGACDITWDAIPTRLRRSVVAALGQAAVAITTDVLIVGAGQSGLSMSYSLKAKGVRHFVVDAGEVGSSWSTRWDSFQLNTPNSTISLPGLGPVTSAGFFTHNEVQELLKSYARDNDLPVVSSAKVQSAVQTPTGFSTCTDLGIIESKVLIIATGEYSVPRLPDPLRSLPQHVSVFHSSQYRAPSQIAPGPVLVVGGGQSGAQIVEDLLQAGRKVFWSLSDRPSNIRRLRGKDFMEWWDIGGLLHSHVTEDPSIRAGVPGALYRARTTEFPLVSGKGDDGLGRSISLQQLEARGVSLLGKVLAAEGETLKLAAVLPQIVRAIAGTRAEFVKLSRIADAYFTGLEEPPSNDDRFVPQELRSGWLPAIQIDQLDLKAEQVSTVISATGFHSGWPWLHIESVLDEHGYPIGDDGRSPIPGLFFLGMFNIQRLSSTCLCNGGRDSAVLVSRIEQCIITGERAVHERDMSRDSAKIDEKYDLSA